MTGAVRQASSSGTSSSGSGSSDDAPYMLMALLPLPCLPRALRRSAKFDLIVSTVCLFSAFLLHDGLQEEFWVLGLRAPIALTSLDFIGCAFWGWVVTRCTRPKSNNAAAAMAQAQQAQEHTSQDALNKHAHKSSNGGALQRTQQQVNVELVRVSQADNSSSRNSESKDSTNGASSHIRVRLSGESSASPPAPHSSPSSSSSSVLSSSVDPTPWSSYLCIGLLILTSNFLAIASLSFVDYPLKVIVRSSKLIPTMLIGRLIMGKQYTSAHYLAACMLCMGVILFSLADIPTTTDTSSADTDDADTEEDASSRPGMTVEASRMYVGILLLVGSVLVDALNPNIAEKFMNKRGAAKQDSHTQPQQMTRASNPSHSVHVAPVSSDADEELEGAPLLSSANGSDTSGSRSSLPPPPPPSSGGGGGHGHGHGGEKDPHAVNYYMFKTNVYVVPLLLLGVVVWGEMPLVVSCVMAVPSVLPLALLYCTASYAGIHAYTSMIQRHGSALTVGMATLRKICTIVMSYLLIGASDEEELLMPADGDDDTPSDGLTPQQPHSVPVKHFGSQHLLPSALIIAGLMLSAWIDRKKGGAAASQTAPAPSSRRADARDSTHDANTAADEIARRSGGTNGVAGAASHVSSLAAELGLETGGETECETDMEQGQGATGSGRGRMQKHAPHIAAQIQRDMWNALNAQDDEPTTP